MIIMFVYHLYGLYLGINRVVYVTFVFTHAMSIAIVSEPIMAVTTFITKLSLYRLKSDT